MDLRLGQNIAAFTKIKERFVKNTEGFFETFKWPLLFLMITALLDAFSTFCFMYVLGVEYEIHPIVRELSEWFGPLLGPFIGGFLKIYLGIVALIYLRKFERPLLCLASTLYCYAFMHNLRVTGIFNLL